MTNSGTIITKAYITKVPETGQNKFEVRVPFMEDNTDNEAIFEALLCTDPSSFGGYEVDDCVYVTFEDVKMNTCVILGKLYTGKPNDSSSYVIANELKVTEAATLPASTKLGTYTAQDLTNLYNAAVNGIGGGTINDDDLKGYVKWVNTSRDEGNTDYYADKIRCMNGEEYDDYWANTPEDEKQSNVLYFLTSVPESEIEYDEDSEDASV